MSKDRKQDAIFYQNEECNIHIVLQIYTSREITKPGHKM